MRSYQCLFTSSQSCLCFRIFHYFTIVFSPVQNSKIDKHSLLIFFELGTQFFRFFSRSIYIDKHVYLLRMINSANRLYSVHTSPLIKLKTCRCKKNYSSAWKYGYVLLVVLLCWVLVHRTNQGRLMEEGESVLYTLLK